MEFKLEKVIRIYRGTARTDTNQCGKVVILPISGYLLARKWSIVKRPLSVEYCFVQPAELQTSHAEYLMKKPISGRVDWASVTQTNDFGSIPGRVKPKNTKIGIHSFPAWRSAIKGTVWSLGGVW